MKPRIAIPVPHSTDLAYSERSWPQYAAAVTAAGGEPVKIPLGLPQDTVADLIATCQGVLLPGSGADVNPQKFGQEAIPECAPADPAREAVDELLLQDAHSLYKPLLGICFGTQSLNVWRGGTLLQDLAILPVNHPAGRAVAIAHTALITPDSLLGSIVDRSEARIEARTEARSEADSQAPQQNGFLRLPINSSHHQAVGIAGDGLRVSARCPQDAVVEAIEGGQATEGATAHFVLGVQWHPERSVEISATSRAIFARLIAEATAWVPRPIRTSVAVSHIAPVAAPAETAVSAETAAPAAMPVPAQTGPVA